MRNKFWQDEQSTPDAILQRLALRIYDKASEFVKIEHSLASQEKQDKLKRDKIIQIIDKIIDKGCN